MAFNQQYTVFEKFVNVQLVMGYLGRLILMGLEAEPAFSAVEGVA